MAVAVILNSILSSFDWALLSSLSVKLRWQADKSKPEHFLLLQGRVLGRPEVCVPICDLHLCYFRQRHQKRSQKRKISGMK